LIKDHLAGEFNNEIRLWTLLMLELWHQVHIDVPATVQHVDMLSAAVG